MHVGAAAARGGQHVRHRQRRAAIRFSRRGLHITVEQVLADQNERDRRDAARATLPMVAAPDAVVVDSSHMSLAEVVDTLEQYVRQAQRRAASLCAEV
jgi:CMP/dCMP kinase